MQDSRPASIFLQLTIWYCIRLIKNREKEAILASAFAKKDHEKARTTASRVLQFGLLLGLCLSIVLGIGMQFASRLFTKDVDVLWLMHIGIPMRRWKTWERETKTVEYQFSHDPDRFRFARDTSFGRCHLNF